MSKKKNKSKSRRLGTIHWRRGYQSLEKLLEITNKNDKILFPSRMYDISETIAIHEHLNLFGKAGSILHVANPPENAKKSKKGFAKQAIVLSKNAAVHMSNLIIEADPETIGLELDSTFTGEVLLDNIITRHAKSLFYRDDRTDHPIIKASGAGVLKIKDSSLNFIAIDAPNMDLIIEGSEIGTFNQSSLIRVNRLEVINSKINNAQVSAKKGQHSGLKSNGAIAFEGVHQLVRTELEPLNPARSELYPDAMTYITGLPNSKLRIKDILSTVPEKAPYYRHFNLNKSLLIIEGTTGLEQQLLTSVAIDSNVKKASEEWLVNPDEKANQHENNKLVLALNQS